MAAKRDEVGQQVRDVIERVLRQRLGLHGFREATVRAGFGHDGDPMLFVVAHFDLVPEPIDVGITVGVIDALRDELDEIGEGRFPIVNYDFHDDQAITTKKKKRVRA